MKKCGGIRTNIFDTSGARRYWPWPLHLLPAGAQVQRKGFVTVATKSASSHVYHTYELHSDEKVTWK